MKKATKAKAVFSAEQEAAIRRMIAAGIDGAVNGKIPFPLQLAQRYLERICPPMIEKIIQAEKGGLTRDIRKELEAQGEQIMMGRVDQVKQKVNDWIDGEMRRAAEKARSQLLMFANSVGEDAFKKANPSWISQAWAWMLKMFWDDSEKGGDGRKKHVQ